MFKSILVPFDNSDQAKHALETAVGMARALDAEVTILSVSELPDFDDMAYTIFEGQIPGFSRPTKDDLVAMQREYYKRLKEELIENAAEIVDGYEKVEYRATCGRPIETIMESADSEMFDVVVMGNRGLGALRGALGSVSFAVVRSSRVPVLIVK